ncbi:MAG: ATP-dependent DNA ligase [Theionarchaea archaeon]|nr:ATP-dependent DNA ligase [Theionarchaea archaeon]
MQFSELARVCEQVGSTRKKLKKVHVLSEFLRSVPPDEIAFSVLLITGQVFPESSSTTLDVSWRTVQNALKSQQRPLFQKALSIADVYTCFQEIAKTSQRKKKERIISSLLGQASDRERTYILKNFFGEMRIGASEGIVLEAIAEAAGLSSETVKRSHALLGDLGETALRALTHKDLPTQITLFSPIKPMLAQMGDIQNIKQKMALEYKLDGARIQIHKNAQQVRIFSRRLTDVTESLPDIVTLVGDFPESVTEGEVVAERKGKPLPFQEVLRRFRRIHDVGTSTEEIPLRLYIFDLLYLEGKTLLDKTYLERTALLSEIAGPFLVQRLITGSTKEADEFLSQALRAGHEGLMAKQVTSTYVPGKRDKSWLKIKPTETLDLVIKAAEWGHGRRKGWLSNYHLATREGAVIGKTFKGLTDSQFQDITVALLALKVSENTYTVYVRPKVVVEVVFNEIQKSPTYPSGYALRFARITNIRDDKSAGDADSIDKVRELYERQFAYKAKRRL